MTKQELINSLAVSIGTLQGIADTFGDIGAFMEGFKDDQETQYWFAYEALRAETLTLTHLIRMIQEQV